MAANITNHLNGNAHTCTQGDAHRKCPCKSRHINSTQHALQYFLLEMCSMACILLPSPPKEKSIFKTFKTDIIVVFETAPKGAPTGSVWVKPFRNVPLQCFCFSNSFTQIITLFVFICLHLSLISVIHKEAILVICLPEAHITFAA